MDDDDDKKFSFKLSEKITFPIISSIMTSLVLIDLSIGV
jgi:hypothetical protein